MSGGVVPNIQRIFLLIKEGDGGRVDLSLSAMPPASLDATMAVLIMRGALPVGFPQDIPLVSDPTVDPTLRGPSGATALATVTIGETATIAIQAGIRQLALTGVAGVKKGDNILLFPTAGLPAGYAVLGAVATDDAALQVSMLVPLVAIGAKYSITARVMRIG